MKRFTHLLTDSPTQFDPSLLSGKFPVLLYYVRWLGTTMTEQLGFTLGLLACPLLLRGFMRTSAKSWLPGLAC